MTRVRYTLAVALGALAITACGGGDDDGNTDACATNPTAPGCAPAGTNLAPIAEANGPYSGTAGTAISFSASGSRDPEAGALTYSWSWGDGTANGTGETATHTYTTARAADNPYRVRLTVTDDKGATATDSATATVAATGGSTSTTGTLAVELTDAPFPFDTVSAANVFVVRVDAQLAATTDAAANTGVAGDVANTNPASGWVTVASVNRAINLLDLQNGRTLSLGQRAMPVGAYQGFRLVIDASQSNVALRGGGNATVTYPNTGRIGLRIVPESAFNVTAGGTTTIFADFDVGKSFRMAGANIGGGLQFVSSVRGMQTSRGKVPGRYRVATNNGDVLVAGASIELLPAGTPNSDADPAKVIATTSSDLSGQFLFRFVTPGTTYTVRATPPASRSALGVQSLQVVASPDGTVGSTASRGGTAEFLVAEPR